MTQKLGYRDNGKTSEEGINRIGSRLLSCAGVMHTTDLAVTATGTPDNKVNVAAGDIVIGVNSPNTADPDYFYHGWNTASEPLTISANASGNPRIDAVVAYVDLAVQSAVSNDNPAALKFKVVAGTAAASPVAPTDAEIQASVGASNPWLPLAIVAVANGFSSIVTGDITNQRSVASALAIFADAGLQDFVGSGLVFSLSTGLVGKMTTGWAVINGEFVNKAYLLHTFTASKDTYVDLPLGSKPTATDDLTYTAVANGAAAPALAANSIRIAKVVTSGAAITSVTTSGADSLNNAIRATIATPVHTHADNGQGGQLANAGFTTAVSPVTRYNDTLFDHIPNNGCVWSGDSYGVTRAASMTAGVVYINGVRLTVAAVTARTFTASRDTYVYLTDNGDGTAAFTYSEVTNNNTSPAAPANGVLVGIIVTGATFITNVGSVNQGQEDKVLPIASSIAYTTTDSLGNLICPRDPTRRILGYRQILSNFTTTSVTAVQITGLTAPVIIPNNGRKIEGFIHTRGLYNGANQVLTSLWEGVVASGTLFGGSYGISSGSGASPGVAFGIRTPTSGSKTYNAGLLVNAGTGTFEATTGYTGSITIRQS